jgi:hypothetical protein
MDVSWHVVGDINTLCMSFASYYLYIYIYIYEKEIHLFSVAISCVLCSVFSPSHDQL